MTTLAEIIIIDVISILSGDGCRSHRSSIYAISFIFKRHVAAFKSLGCLGSKKWRTVFHKPHDWKKYKTLWTAFGNILWPLRKKMHFLTFILYIIYSLLQMISAVGEQFIFNCWKNNMVATRFCHLYMSDFVPRDDFNLSIGSFTCKCLHDSELKWHSR